MLIFELGLPVLSRKKMHFFKSWRKLMNYKPEKRIPWLFTDFDNIKDFPWPWKILVFPWRFPNRGNPGSWLVLACQIHWHLNKKCFFFPTFIHYTGTKPILATGYMHSKSTFTRNTQLLKTSVFMQKNMLQYVSAGMDVKSSRIQSLPLPFLTSALFKLSICQHINLLKISIFPFKKLF